MLDGRINILHISDLHYHAASSHDHNVVLTAFLKDLQVLSKTLLKPDLIVFSGDLVREGDSAESYAGVLDKVINPALDITKLDENRLIVVPGNHDVQRSAVQANVATQQGLEQLLKTRASLNQHYLLNHNSEYVRAKLQNFLELKECLGNSTAFSGDLYVENYYLRELNLSMVTINTAWMSRGGLDEWNDKEKLLVPEASLRGALDRLPEVTAKVLVSHHPLDWMAEHSSSDLRRLVDRKGLIHLFGHMHEPISQIVRSTSGRSVSHQSGALFTDRDRYNGYAVISIDPQEAHVEFNLRSYYERRGVFDIAIDVAQEGRWYPSPEARAFWLRATDAIRPDDLARWVVDRVRPELRESLDEGFSDRPVSEIFVPPRLSKRSSSPELSEEEEDTSEQAKMYSVDDLAGSTENYLIVGKREYGKTTLLRQLALSLIENCGSLMPMLPVRSTCCRWRV